MSAWDSPPGDPVADLQKAMRRVSHSTPRDARIVLLTNQKRPADNGPYELPGGGPVETTMSFDGPLESGVYADLVRNPIHHATDRQVAMTLMAVIGSQPSPVIVTHSLWNECLLRAAWNGLRRVEIQTGQEECDLIEQWVGRVMAASAPPT